MPRGAGSRAFTVRAGPPTTAAHGRHSPLPSRAGGGVNGFYLSCKGKSKEQVAPKYQKGSPPPGLCSRVLISCQAPKSSLGCRSAEARQEHSGNRFPSRQAQVSVPASPRASLHNVTSMEGKKLSRRPGLQVHPMGWKGSKVQKHPVSKQEPRHSYSCQAVFEQFQLSNHRGRQRLVLPGETHTCCCPSGEKTAPKILSLNKLPHSLPLSGQDEH